MLVPLLLSLPLVQDVAPEIEGFRYRPGRIPVGRLYHYAKSNIDGTNPSHVDLYVASETRIESFKYHEGTPEATLVTAEMDWRTFSVGVFETTKLRADGTSTFVARLAAHGDVLHGEFGGSTFRVPVKQFPWHTYDFDLASLNVALRYLEDPEGIVQVGMIDQVRGLLAPKGFAELAYEADEERGGVPCRRYWLDGPGLEDRGGNLWVRIGRDPVIVDYEIDLPDESSMRSGKLRLLSTEELTREEWARHQREALRSEGE